MTAGNISNNPFLLENRETYLAWRTKKLLDYPSDIKKLIVPIKNPYQITPQEHLDLLQKCSKTNLVIYQLEADLKVDKQALHALAAQLGLHRIDHNLCADEDGIAALQVISQGRSSEYIPYTNRPLNWHTDGYYNTSEQQVHAILMHCARPALTGGENMFLDPEIAYIKLRDNNPDFITALMTPDVMTIPANVEQGIELRPTQTGPVFSVNPQTGTLHMRYTARTRNIIWKPSATTQAALEYLTHLFKEENSPYLFRHKLAANQGVLCNNVLHNRTGFTDSEEPEQQRLLYRIRFHDRIEESM